jgi:hypothetical protein
VRAEGKPVFGPLSKSVALVGTIFAFLWSHRLLSLVACCRLSLLAPKNPCRAALFFLSQRRMALCRSCLSRVEDVEFREMPLRYELAGEC